MREDAVSQRERLLQVLFQHRNLQEAATNQRLVDILLQGNLGIGDLLLFLLYIKRHTTFQKYHNTEFDGECKLIGEGKIKLFQ